MAGQMQIRAVFHFGRKRRNKRTVYMAENGNTLIKKTIFTTDKEAQYDEKAKEKTQIIEEEYQIPMEQKLREDLKIMCNLSQGVKEEGIAIGRQLGIEIGRKSGIEIGRKSGIEIGHKSGLEQGRREMTNNVIENMHKKGYTVMEIADVLKMSSEEVIERLEGCFC